MTLDFDLKGKKVAVLGLGVEGVSSAEYLLKKGAEVTVLDENPTPSTALVEKIDQLGASFFFGEGVFEHIHQFHLVVRSPGIKLHRKEIQIAKEHGVVITSQTKLFFDLCPCHIIGVTGTKGKGTTSSLIYEMLKKSGKDAYLGGNIGKPPLDFLDKLSTRSIVVLELSSFQLLDLHKSPHIGVLLMITSEHLDYHATVEEYIDAKRNLIRSQTRKDFAIINRDYIASHESDIHTAGKIFQVSRERPCEEGCFVKNDSVFIRKDGEEIKVIDVDQILLPGKHNLENICAASMAAFLAGVSIEDIAYVLHTFKGLEHRLELIRDVKGVRYFDDSFSTTPETAIAAIEAFNEPEVLILGGSGKQSDFTALGKTIGKATNIRAIIGIGKEWERIKSAIKEGTNAFLLIEGATDMKQVVKAAATIAQPGDVVLLTPACASFDMFKNYKDRGEQFKKEVMKLI